MLKYILLAVLLLIIISLAVIAQYALHFIAPYAIIRPARFDIHHYAFQFPNGLTPEGYGLKAENITVVVEDSIRLAGWFVHADSAQAKGTIVLLHGIGSCKEHMLGTVNLLVQAGFNVITYDSRAHGESGGTYCTYGYYEKQDVCRVIDFMQARYTVGKIGIYGVSLGGAVALQAMAEDKRIQCGVVESTFATLDEIVYDYMQRMLHIPFHIVSARALSYAEAIAHFQADSVRPEQAATRILQPILLTHGDADQHISCMYGRRIFQHLSSQDKEWCCIPGAEHNNLHSVAGAAYEQKVVAFFQRHLQYP